MRGPAGAAAAIRRLATTAAVRRAGSVATAILIAAAVYLLVVRDGDPGRGNAARTPESLPKQVRALVGDMSLAEKVDAVLLVGFAGHDEASPILGELRSRPLGGVLVRAENWPDAAAGRALIAGLARASRRSDLAPPLVAVAQEGGDYRALPDLPPAERQLAIGDEGSEALAREWAIEAAAALREAGFHLNLAPVADVATLDSPVADRAFSDDPAIVARLTAAAVRGCAKAGLGCVARHFPGLGAASQSTDAGPATVGADVATLEERDLAAFEAAIAAGIPAVMLSHAFYAAYDPVTPASLSRPIATRLLRRRLGFEGVALTDDLSAGAIKAGHRVRDAAVAALAAGADLLLVSAPEDQRGVRGALVEAVRSRQVAPARLDEAVGRVLELKQSLGLL